MYVNSNFSKNLKLKNMSYILLTERNLSVQETPDEIMKLITEGYKYLRLHETYTHVSDIPPFKSKVTISDVIVNSDFIILIQ